MSLWPFLAMPRFFGRLMATGNTLVFLMFIAFNMYAFHQYGSFPSSPDQGGNNQQQQLPGNGYANGTGKG
jgi:hypothetical protein